MESLVLALDLVGPYHFLAAMPGAPTADFERLGAFYLGRPFDL